MRDDVANPLHPTELTRTAAARLAVGRRQRDMTGHHLEKIIERRAPARHLREDADKRLGHLLLGHHGVRMITENG